MTKELKTTRNLKVIEQPALCVAEGKVGYGKRKAIADAVELLI